VNTSSVESRRVFSSIPCDPSLLSGVLRLLAWLDELPKGATGVLKFGAEGVILLEARKICWAMTRQMRFRLTDILRHQSTPPLPREAIEEIYRRCQQTGKPIGEALVAGGLVSEQGLRAALLKHIGEALAQLAKLSLTPDSFVNHTRSGYDPRFAFSACELLAMYGALDDPARAAAAQLELAGNVVPGSVGAAFVRSSSASGAQVIAADRGCDLAVHDLNALCNWAAGLFDVARTFDPEVRAARANWGNNGALVTWRTKDVGYIGVCSSRAAAACLFSNIVEPGARASGVVRAAPRSGDGAP
jgi:hypothetical protein